MKRKIIYITILINIFALSQLIGQETLPIYTDYLTDNIYLIHPAGAGISNYGKIRLTARKQWLDYSNAPQLQTMSFHMPLGNNSAIGAVFFNDKVGHFSKSGGQISYAYHINFDENTTNQLSFGISAVLLQNSLDGHDFNLYDSDVTNTLIHKNYLNTDVSFAYRNKGFFSFYTIKNLVLVNRGLLNNTTESNNLRRHLVSIGYRFNENDKETLLKLQPSVMVQYIEQTQEIFLDTNLKIFISFSNGGFWGGLSYRKSLDANSIENSNHFTPFLGVKFKKFVLSYSYTKQVNNTIFTLGDYHQITLGYNFKIQKYKTATWDL